MGLMAEGLVIELIRPQCGAKIASTQINAAATFAAA
jgi:hypothetical protein